MPDQLTLMNLFCLAEEIQRKLLLSRWFLLKWPGDGAPFYSFKQNFQIHFFYILLWTSASGSGSTSKILPGLVQRVTTQVCYMSGLNTGSYRMMGTEHWCRQEFVTVLLAAVARGSRKAVIKRFKFPFGCSCYLSGAPID